MSISQADVLAAMRMAQRLHRDQTDKAGKPYVTHLADTAQWVLEHKGSREAVAAAWLHDSVEDGHWAGEEIDAFVGPEVAAIILAVTRREAEHYQEYIWRIYRHENPMVALVKYGDLVSNSQEDRLELLPMHDARRLRGKYAEAKNVLEPAARRVWVEPTPNVLVDSY